MKNKMRVLITSLVGFLLALTLQRCSKSDPTPVDTVDKIKIVNVTPSTDLVDGQQTNFTVTVSYNLYKSKTGTLIISVNNATNVSVYREIASKVVNAGSGQYAFNVSTSVKNWGSTGDFKVYTSLAPDPVPSGFTPYASDTFVLIPKQ